MFKSVLIVCVGNICRSPMAEYQLKNNLPHLNIFSAGLNAVVGKTAEKTAIKLMKEKNIDISGHCSQQLNSLLVSRADIILVMEESHINRIHNEYPLARGKVFLLGKWIKNQQIADPYKRNKEAFQYSLKLIEESLSEWEKVLS